ncbi:MAG: hypothetical protein U0228_27190 [Myxococcaceae bacterium]
MKLNRLKVVALAALMGLTAPIVFSACSPECVDLYDCAAKAKAAKTEFTCESGVCKAGSPFPATDGGTP